MFKYHSFLRKSCGGSTLHIVYSAVPVKLPPEKLSLISSLHFFTVSRKPCHHYPSLQDMVQKHQQPTDSYVNVAALNGAEGQLTTFSSYTWKTQCHSEA